MKKLLLLVFIALMMSTSAVEAVAQVVAYTPNFGFPLIPRGFRGDWSIDWRNQSGTLENVLTSYGARLASAEVGLATVGTFQDSLDALNLRVDSCENSLSQNYAQDMTQDERLSSAEVKLDSLNSITNSNTSNIVTLFSRVTSAETVLGTHSTHISNIFNNLSTVETRLNNFQSSINLINANISNLQLGQASLTSRVSTIENELLILSAGTSFEDGTVVDVTSGTDYIFKEVVFSETTLSVRFEVSLLVSFSDGSACRSGQWVFTMRKASGYSAVISAVNSRDEFDGGSFTPSVKRIEDISFSPVVIGTGTLRFRVNGTTAGFSDPGKFNLRYSIRQIDFLN